MGALRANNLKKLFVHQLGPLGGVPRFRANGADVTCGNFRCGWARYLQSHISRGMARCRGRDQGTLLAVTWYKVEAWPLGCRENELDGRSLLCDVTSCYILWPMAAQQCSASGGRRQWMQDVFRASMVSSLWHFYHVALPQSKIQLASYSLATNCVSPVKNSFASYNSNGFNHKTLHFGLFV